MPFGIQQLRYALAAADHGSFHRAARALAVEESTLSRNILRLERVIGAKLFIRSRSGVVPTIAGRQFMPQARHLVANSDRLVETMRKAGQGRAGGLAVGFNGPISAGNLRATLFAWRASNPEVDLEGVEGERLSLLAGLDAGVLDLAVMPGEAGYQGLRRVPFWSERLLVALPASHPLAEKESVEWTDLRDETFLLTVEDPGPELRDMVLGRLAAFGMRPKIRMRCVSREWIMSVLGGGLGVTVTYEGASGARYPDVVLRELHDAHGRTLIGYSGYWRKASDNPALRRFLTFVRSRYSLAFEID
ncbi:LysR family transcriptional regulator [Sphingopyxis sp. OPL5]|uniref:LysR substrate-binding domain-containing protein n=1 Tax=Sphingopyxis sp. OPL5 TaxID=2486273 RepID=UPI00164D3CB9|nr:LysR family transcriptional regulator [Sphingopyxis sp. OPL5]QNO27230.1 LysR family transcriptional regulator [Sphingopyxis sp. OPL5]